MSAEAVLLLKDSEGEKIGRMGGLLIKAPPRTIVRGELLFGIPKNKVVPRKDGKTAHNYQVASDPTVTLYCDADYLAPLSDYEFHLLEPIKSRASRYEVFQKDVLDWGSKLKEGDHVYVTLPAKSAIPHQRALSIVRYIGAHPYERGILFGIEIVEAEFRYHGSSNGFFGGVQYFTCEDNCALFVLLDRLSLARDKSQQLLLQHQQPTADLHRPQGQARNSEHIKQRSHLPKQPLAKQDEKRATYHGTSVATPAGIKEKKIPQAKEQSEVEYIKEALGTPVVDYEEQARILAEFERKQRERKQYSSILSTHQPPPPHQPDPYGHVSPSTSASSAKAHQHGHGYPDQTQRDLPRMRDQHTSVQKPVHHPGVSSSNTIPSRQQRSMPSSDKHHSLDQRSDMDQQLHQTNQPHNIQPGDVGAESVGSNQHNLMIGSRVKMPTNIPNEPFRYGVIRWIGGVPGLPGLVAGVEMDMYMDGCTDGTLMSTGQKFFSCQPGMGMYYPLVNLQSDDGAWDFYLRQWQETESSKKKLEADKKQLQQQLDMIQQEKQSLLAAQQESIAFGIEPWKVPRQDVEMGRMVGGGGWGAVHEGKLKVAVKQFYPNILSKQNISRLKREMRMLALIRHPNLLQFIAAVFDENDDHKQNPPYIITELLDINLRSAYEENKLSSHSLLSIFQDTARALDYLHRRHESIIHRDVSSANVLLKCQPNDRWIAKLSDLGSANLAQEAYTMNEGARVYCAPEAFTFETDARSAGTLTPKVDVYSYGIMLCEVATSTFPERKDFPSMLDRVRCEWPQLHQLIVACTKSSPEQRPTMATILASLEAFPPQH